MILNNLKILTYLLIMKVLMIILLMLHLDLLGFGQRGFVFFKRNQNVTCWFRFNPSLGTRGVCANGTYTTSSIVVNTDFGGSGNLGLTTYAIKKTFNCTGVSTLAAIYLTNHTLIDGTNFSAVGTITNPVFNGIKFNEAMAYIDTPGSSLNDAFLYKLNATFANGTQIAFSNTCTLLD